MKSIYKIFTVIIFVIFHLSSEAQTNKFGHIDLDALIQVMPEIGPTEAEFDKFQKELNEVMVEMQQDYQTKLKELEELGSDVSEVRRNAKFSELQSVQQRIQQYQQSAQQQVQLKYQELLDPIYKKATDAVEEVAREHDLLYVFETGTNAIIYKSSQSIDLMPLVKEKLGIMQ